MATKKQKREAALARREKFLADERAAGLAAQALDHDEQAKKNALMQAEADRINQKYENILRSELHKFLPGLKTNRQKAAEK
jgi:hypothetical protein